MFDFDALEETDQPSLPGADGGEAGTPSRRPGSRPTDEPDWEAPAEAGWWHVVSEKGCWTECSEEGRDGEIIEWFWKGEVVAGKYHLVISEGVELLFLRDDGGLSQRTMIRGPMPRLDGGLREMGIVLEPLPSPPPLEARAGHRRVVEARNARGRLGRAGTRRVLEEAARVEEATPLSAQLLPDVPASPEFAVLWAQAKALSGRAFVRRFDAEDFLGTQRLTLLTNSSRTSVVGFCFYLLPLDGYLWVEQVAVEEKFRRKGLGKMLMRWAIDQADALGCWAVRLSALEHAVPFYRSLGFQDFHKDGDFGDFERTARQERSEGEQETGWPMHIRLRQHRKPPRLTGESFFPFQYRSV